MSDKTFRNDFKQEIFDKVANHLLTQNCKALNEDGRCAYRGINNTKCAAGCLIPDNDYETDIETKAVYAVEYFYQAGYSDDELDLIRVLQLIHDHDHSSIWKNELRKLAIKQKLQVKFE